VAELKVTYAKKGKPTVGRAPNGDTVVEVRRDLEGTVLQTKNQAWRIVRGDEGTAVLDAAGATVASVRHRRFQGEDIALAGGEVIELRGNRLQVGHGCRFGDLAAAKAPFLAPQRYFTLTLSDALLAREDRELLIALMTCLAESHISISISVSASSPA
jgi:hypothetical protein